jgi:hydrogenase maturation factor
VTPAECHSDHCITCGDDGVPMQVLKVDDSRGLALCVDEAGEKSTVEIELVLPVTTGDELLVHAGTALVRLA